MRKPLSLFTALLLLVFSGLAGQSPTPNETVGPRSGKSGQNQDFLIVPGESLGRIHLGMAKQTMIGLLGQPTRETSDGSLVYQAKQGGNKTEIFLAAGQVAQINFTSKTFNTKDGVNTRNFLDHKFAHAFAKWKLAWRFVNIKYSLKSGGLTFYNLNADSADSEFEVQYVGVVHRGLNPVYEVLSLEGEPNGGWKQWDGRDIYSP